jgi:hypothetical protein
MYINRIYVDQVALARSLSASVTPRRDVLARLPQRPAPRKRPHRLLRLIGSLRGRLSSKPGSSTTQLKTKYRDRTRRRAVVPPPFLQPR